MWKFTFSALSWQTRNVTGIRDCDHRVTQATMKMDQIKFNAWRLFVLETGKKNFRGAVSSFYCWAVSILWRYSISPNLLQQYSYHLHTVPSRNMPSVFLEYCSLSTARVRCFMYYWPTERCAHFHLQSWELRRRGETSESSRLLSCCCATDGNTFRSSVQMKFFLFTTSTNFSSTYVDVSSRRSLLAVTLWGPMCCQLLMLQGVWQPAWGNRCIGTQLFLLALSSSCIW